MNNFVHIKALSTFLFMANRIKADTSLNISKIKALKNFSSDAELARFLGVSPALLSRWKTRNTYDIDKIIEAIPNISISWLLTGEGDMLTESSTQTGGHHSVQMRDVSARGNVSVHTASVAEEEHTELETMRAQLQVKDRTIESLLAQIDKLTTALTSR